MLVSDALRQIVAGHLDSGLQLRDLGEITLKDISRRERVWQLEAEGLVREFPPVTEANESPGNLRSVSDRWRIDGISPESEAGNFEAPGSVRP